MGLFGLSNVLRACKFRILIEASEDLVFQRLLFVFSFWIVNRGFLFVECIESIIHTFMGQASETTITCSNEDYPEMACANG